jgi:hypothetical protein
MPRKKKGLNLRQGASNCIRMLLCKVTRKRTDMVCGAIMLPVVHPVLNTLQAAVLTLNFTELDMQLELDNCIFNLTVKIAYVSVVLEPRDIRINPSDDMLDTSVS